MIKQKYKSLSYNVSRLCSVSLSFITSKSPLSPPFCCHVAIIRDYCFPSKSFIFFVKDNKRKYSFINIHKKLETEKGTRHTGRSGLGLPNRLPVSQRV